MNTLSKRLLPLILFGIAVTALFSAQPAQAVTLNFVELPNEGGIHFSGDTVLQIFNNDVPGSETYHVAPRIVPSGYPADARAGLIGIQRDGALITSLTSWNLQADLFPTRSTFTPWGLVMPAR